MATSARPPVRVVRTSQHALRNEFETFYIHSLGCTTCRIWVSSQLGHFGLIVCRHDLMNQDKSYIGGPLYTCQHKFCIFFHNLIFGILGITVAHFGLFVVLFGLFSTCFDISILDLVYTLSWRSHKVSSSSIPLGTHWPTLQQKKVFLHSWL